MKELKIEGLFYLSMLEGETEDQAIDRFSKLIESVGIIDNNTCCNYEEQEAY